MQLVVSEEDSSCGSCAASSNHCREQQRKRRETVDEMAMGAARLNSNVGEAILSADLRDQFETMKRVWRQARRQCDGVGSSSDIDEETKERRALIIHDLKRKERDTAIETAIKVDNEISQWHNGIADLEALLAEEKSESSSMGNIEEQQLRTNKNGPFGIRETAFVAHNSSNNSSNIRQYIRPPPPAQLRFPFIPQAIPTENDEVLDDEVECSANDSACLQSDGVC